MFKLFLLKRCPVNHVCLDFIVLIIYLLFVSVLRTETYLIGFLPIFRLDKQIMVIPINALTEIALGYSASLRIKLHVDFHNVFSSCFVTSTTIRLLVGAVTNKAAGMYNTET